MKNIIIALLVLANVATLIVATTTIKHVKEADQRNNTALVNALDKLYFGFCLDAKDHGYDKLDSYQRLCGQE
jgi:hypothetical protein